MAKFKYSEKAILKATSKEVIISKVITNFGSNTTKYELKTGEKVSDNDLLKFTEAEKISKVLHKSVKKGKTNIKKLAKDISEISDEKTSLSPMEHADETPINKEIKKTESNAKTE